MYSFSSAQFGVNLMVGGGALSKWSQCAFFGVRSTKFGTNAALKQNFYRCDKLPARYYEKKLAQAQGKVELLASALHGTWNMLSRYSERMVGWSSVYRKWAKGAKDDANVSEFQKCIQGLSDNRDLDNFLLTNADTTFNEISLIEARSLARLLPGGSGHITAPIRAISKGSNTANPVTTSNLYLLGLTLHRAHHLVKFDVDFLDGGDRQVLKRIYRIGQKEEGFV